MINELLDDLKTGYDNAVVALRREVAKVRTGRANPNMLDGIVIEYYGTPTPIMNLASVKVADARLITIQPWEKAVLGKIEKAILQSDLGITPSNDGVMIRLPIPPLTGERRKEFTKMARDMGEKSKIAVRNQRRDMNDMIKQLKKDGEISEDDEKRGLTKVQELTEQATKKIDEVVAEKEKEIMEV